MTTDLTVGKVPKVLISFSLPLLLSTVLQQFYNVADSMIVGRFAGEAALASIGAAYPITLFYVAIATGASMGCSVVISQIFGTGRMDTLKRAMSTSLLTLLVLGVILSTAGILLSGTLMHILNAQNDIFSDARAYLAIYSIGALPMLVYNAASGIFTGLGDSRTPLILLFISSLLNVILDYIAVKTMGLGVAGAAWATTISQAVAAVLSIFLLLMRTSSLCAAGKGSLFDKNLLGEILRAAVPCILQQSCVALTHTIVQSILNTYDTAIIAGYEAASKLHNFAYMGMNTIGTAFASFAAQCYGAAKYDRIKEGFRTTAVICLGCTLFVLAIFQLLPWQLIGMFVESSSASSVIEAGTNYLRIISPVYLIICFIISAGGLLRGIGKSSVFFIETLAEFIVRVVMCFVLTKLLDSYTGLMWAWYFGSSVGVVMCLLLTRKVFRLLSAAKHAGGY